MKARYEIVARSTVHVVLRDIGHSAGFMSITNDAEGVVEHLIENGSLKKGMRLEYYDSDGNKSQILHDGLDFKGFAP